MVRSKMHDNTQAAEYTRQAVRIHQKSVLTLTNCLIADQQHTLFSAHDQSQVILNNCQFKNNKSQKWNAESGRHIKIK
jgi:hypothetical protein